MRKTLVIEFESSPEDARDIVRGISAAAVKSIGRKGLLLGMRTEEPLQVWGKEEEIQIPCFMNEKKPSA